MPGGAPDSISGLSDLQQPRKENRPGIVILMGISRRGSTGL